ncbi:MAG: hypothetical protein A2Y62_03260 [Candidatus Fischerbacteria bacterium RBG_13_37_8]|uniref:Thioredoxin domain-containing protein n=1 Tax=Candidatus Fischerbacteria bacterium RBG_13_37_8 TaxID=1817863 RepID=A0A1F5VVB7_9BACT|nr:MAG: hypothetical protein A2Y62_03260 [Candidatus Fischerbacteria bacterium RBG_13_37_8]
MKKICVIIILMLSMPLFSQISQKENAQKAVESVKHLFPQWQQLEFEFDEIKESIIPDFLQARFYVTHHDKNVPMVIYFRKDGKYAFVGQLINVEESKSLTNEFAGEIKYDTVDMSTLNLKNAARKGDLGAPVTIIEYSDFQCPYCKRAESVTKQICKEYKDKIVFIYKHIPWPKHNYSVKLAVAAECAREQNEQAFWNFHDVFFSDEFSITDDKDLTIKIMEIANNNELNNELFKKCYENNKTENIVNDHFNESKFLGISSTPTFVVNGERILGALPYQSFRDVIEKNLDKPNK